jgi:hypothetical protein
MMKTVEVMTVAQARKRYAGNWLALEVISRDRTQAPKTVRLIAKAHTRDELCEKIKSVPEVYITFGGPFVPRGQVILY